MRNFLLLMSALTAVPLWAGEPVVVDLRERATTRNALVTVGDLAQITGGNRVDRGRIAALDVAEIAARDTAIVVNRRTVEYRLRLAGYDPADFRLVGAERVGVAAARRAVNPDEVVSAVKAEVKRLLPANNERWIIELVNPVAVRLPEIPLSETLHIQARPLGAIVGAGRVQMNVVLSTGTERLLGFGMLFEVKSDAPLTLPPTRLGSGSSFAVVQASAVIPKSTEVLVRPRQRVTIVARSGALSVTALGEALQQGRLGETIQVQNVDSRKILTSRVIGPAAVEIEMGGLP